MIEDVSSSRLDSLDLLRGAAILGIFLMNSQAMSMPTAAYYNPVAYDAAQFLHAETYSGISVLDYAVWIAIHVMADLKFITMFSVLFGAGILLQAGRLESRGLSPSKIHCRRMAVLLVLGLLHGHVFWYGDVLANYAICGVLLFPFRRLRPSVLIGGGMALASVATLYAWAVDRNIDITVVHWLRTGSATLTAGKTGADFEFAAYSGSWWTQMQSRSWVALDNETYAFLNWVIWRCGGSMLVGMGLFKLRFFHGDWPRAAYVALAICAIPVGWAVTGLGVFRGHANGWWNGDYPDFIGMQFNYWGSFAAALGYLAAGILVALSVAESATRVRSNSDWLSRAVIPVRAVGRTALSNYILQSVIGTTIFYGHGLGYFGWMTRSGLIPIILAVWAVQLTLSTLWIQRHRQGPLEWLWHRTVYGPTGNRA